MFLNPWAETPTVYAPIGRSVTRYDPELVVVALRVSPVAALLTVTVALGSTAPDESVTSPEISPVIFWATRGTDASIRASRTDRYNHRKQRIAILLRRKKKMQTHSTAANL
jgi:hypothetical protein